jgi:phosphatidylserine/phosphatidylglycerophosphate/cardiolipin synthase-like enzyme
MAGTVARQEPRNIGSLDASMDAATDHWFLTPADRGNPATEVDARHPDRAWTAGNMVEPLIHGRTYFARFVEATRDLGPGDRLSFTDWRGDEDEILDDDGTTLGDLLVLLARRGVEVRGLLWRSHVGLTASFNREGHAHLADRVNAEGGNVLLDHRVRTFGSHHQKLVIVERPHDPSKDEAFVGGIDLCHGRRDDAAHRGDPQPEEMDGAYGERPPWHDVQAHVRGPAVGDLAATFRERWNDPTPMDDRTTPWRALLSHIAREPEHPPPMPPSSTAERPPAGTHAVQAVRTYPWKDPEYPFAPHGERSIARAYLKAFDRARRLIYVEDQYFWSKEVASVFAHALRRAPDLRVIVVVPRYPDRHGPVTGPPHRLSQQGAVDIVRKAAGDRFAIYDLEAENGTPIYVHAKVAVIDDVFAAIGSDNMNRRSWTHDSELSITVLDEEHDPREPRDPAGLGDGARRFARNLRLELAREHLQDDDVDRLMDPLDAFEAFRASAMALEAWHRGDRAGPRPPGRLRPHETGSVSPLARLWVEPAIRFVVDPDGRPDRARRKNLI